MRRNLTGLAAVVLVLAAFTAAAATTAAKSAGLDAALIERLTGAAGSLDAAAGVFKVTVPRSDLSVRVAGTTVTPAMGLTSWAAFERMGSQVMVMGDMVVLEDQVNPVLDAALGAGLEVTALHNHFLWDSPKVMFMHVAGMGDEAAVAGAVGKVFAKIRETSGGKGDPQESVDVRSPAALDAKRIDAILGTHGTVADGVYKVVVGRETTMHGERVGSAMGVNTWAAFAGSDQRAVVDGDFAMLEGELQGVLKTLRGARINIVAIHQHMAGDSPRILFLHYWGVGPAAELAHGLRAALDRTAGPAR